MVQCQSDSFLQPVDHRSTDVNRVVTVVYSELQNSRSHIDFVYRKDSARVEKDRFDVNCVSRACCMSDDLYFVGMFDYKTVCDDGTHYLLEPGIQTVLDDGAGQSIYCRRRDAGCVKAFVGNVELHRNGHDWKG